MTMIPDRLVCDRDLRHLVSALDPLPCSFVEQKGLNQILWDRGARESMNEVAARAALAHRLGILWKDCHADQRLIWPGGPFDLSNASVNWLAARRERRRISRYRQWLL